MSNRFALCFLLLAPLLYAEPGLIAPPTVSSIAPADGVLRRMVKDYPDGTGRKLIIEQISPPLPRQLPVEQPAPVPPDPTQLAAWRATWRADAAKPRRLLSIRGIHYPNGLTFLQWFPHGPYQEWQSYEAWTSTDLRSLGLLQEFEVNGTIYQILPGMMAARLWDSRTPPPGPLYFADGSPGFLLVKGDVTNRQAMDPIRAIHEIYRTQGPALTEQWLLRQIAADAEAANRLANPPPVNDIVVRFWPGKKTEIRYKEPRKTPPLPALRGR